MTANTGRAPEPDRGPAAGSSRGTHSSERERRPLSTWVSAVLVAGTFAALLVAEIRRPLRRAVEGKSVRTARNLAVAGLGAATVQLAERPVVAPLARLAHARGWGVVPRLPLPSWARTLAAVVLLDYTLYVWHVLVHRVPALWRFHVVHHADLDLDASTALRFHFGELAVSVPWRAAQVALIGASPRALSIWQTALLLSILFHHSNARLPIAWERWLGRVIVTPRMHGIHHSIVRRETDANWSSGLSIWDRLHGTMRLDVPQAAITIGVPAFRSPEQVRLPRMLRLPFEEQPPSFEFPEGGEPQRTSLGRVDSDV